MLTRLPSHARKTLLFSAVLSGLALLGGCGDVATADATKKSTMQGPSPEVVGAQEAVQSPDIPAIDPQTMEDAEITKVLGDVSYCAYRYTAESLPILAISNTEQGEGLRGVTKIHGRLVELSVIKAPGYESLQEGLQLSAEGLEMRVTSDHEGLSETTSEDLIEAELHFSLEQGLTVGYLGWYECQSK